ncbi:MAG: OsmC family protein [Anaerolineae bacterium]|nr:OsmC family protein [Anaerolineae bacterium]
MTTPATATRNGVDVGQLVNTIDAVKADPNLARFQFQARNEWLDGGRSQTTIQSFYHAGQQDTSRQGPFIVEGDEPPVLLGDDTAPNAVEAVLHALASCLAVGFIYNAAAQGIEVESLESNLEGELDLRAFLGLSEDVRPGYKNIHVTYRAEADAPREKLEELCAYVQKTSPVLDIIRNPVPVSIEMED